MSLTHEVKKNFTRSRHWRTVRDRYLKAHPHCIATGSRKQCEVHHILAFSDRPDLELADGTGEYCNIKGRAGEYLCNLCTLSDAPNAPAHRFVGHLGDWQCSNDRVIEDAAMWLERIKGRRR